MNTPTDLERTLRDCARGVGPLARAYEIHIDAPADLEAIPAVELMRPGPLREIAGRAVKEWSDHPLDEDPRAAVSRVVRRYLGALTTAVIPPLANGIGIEAPPERVRIVMRNDLPHGVVLDVNEVLLSSERPATRRVDGRDVGSLAARRDARPGSSRSRNEPSGTSSSGTGSRRARSSSRPTVSTPPLARTPRSTHGRRRTTRS